MQPAVIITIATMTLVVGVMVYFVVKSKQTEKYGTSALYMQNQLTDGGMYMQSDNAYLPYPNGELTFSPLVNLPKRKYGPMDGNSGLPEGRFVKGNFNNVYTPDLLWCKNGDCNALTYKINAGEIYFNTSGKTFVSVDPARASPDEKKMMATLSMQPDGSICQNKGGDLRDECLVPVINNMAFPVLCIGLDFEGRLHVLNSDPSVKGSENPLYISLDPNSKGDIMTSPIVITVDQRIPYAVLLADCSFGIFSGDGIFAYKACLC
jgi:hypothetical protein